MRSGLFNYLLQLLLFLILSIVLGSLIVLAVGENPATVYRLLFREAFFSSLGIMIAIQRATPLIFTSVAAAIAFQGGAINMGLAGQFMVGAAVAAVAGYGIPPMPGILHVSLIFLLCAVGGAAAAFIPAIFKRMSGINEVITGMISNLLMPYLISLVINSNSLMRAARRGASSEGIHASAQLPQFAELTNGGLGAGTKANVGLFVAAGLALFLAWWLSHSKLGYEIRMTRMNYTFAEFGGIRAGKCFFISMMLSGAVAAMAGAVEILGVWRSYRMGTLVVGDKGLIVALIGGQHLIGSFLAALFYGGLESGAMNVAWFTSIPRPLIDILIEIIVISSALPSMRSFFSGSEISDLERLGGRFVTGWR
jgi:simple sugar transport system permease protein